VQDLESIAKTSVDCGFHLHKDIGPGLLEPVYEVLLFESLKEKGFFCRKTEDHSYNVQGPGFG